MYLSFTLLFFWLFILLAVLYSLKTLWLVVKGYRLAVLDEEQKRVFWFIIVASWFYLLNHIVTKGL